MSAKKQSSPASSPPTSRKPLPIVSGQQTIAEMLTVAATLMSLPATLIYLTVVIGIQVLEISLVGNVMAPLLLACIGLGIFALALIGLTAGIWNTIRTGCLTRLTLMCIWLNGFILFAMLALVVLTPQLE